MHNMLPDTSWIPQDIGWLLGYAIFASIAGIFNFLLWRGAERRWESAYERADELDYKVKCLTMAEEESADVIVDLKRKLDDSKATNKILVGTNAHLSEILMKSYIRNKYGILQRYDDWAINGDKKPKPRSK
jgi:hypothetical protein